MARKARQFYSLKKPYIRASWNLRNLYNLSRLRKQATTGGKTFFQQKYEAKQLTRGYHGEQIREGKWERMFSRYLPSVVEMDARKLAIQDGVEQAAGRGAGRDTKDENQKTPATPYMQMAFWMTERRLDTAIFRSLFASSLRQARMMVVHGHVKVNGKKFTHPSYLLNPGDMFSVDPDMVLFATSNTGFAARNESRNMDRESSEDVAKSGADAGIDNAAEAPTTEAAATTKETEEAAPAEAATLSSTDMIKEDDDDPDWASLPAQPKEAEEEEDDNELDIPAKRPRPTGPPQILDPAVIKSRRATLKELYDLTREAEQTQEPSGKQKQDLRAMRKRIKSYVSRPWRLSEEDIDAVAEELEQMLVAIEERTQSHKPSQSSSAAASSASLASSLDTDGRSDGVIQLLQSDGRRPRAQRDDRNDRASPKANPHLDALAKVEGKWEPKDYMAPFAFIPRYLEVNHTVCSAVYLRHPVARMGLAEVPTPFPLETGNLAFSYYLRRR